MSHKLQSGDQVEILTSKAQRVNESWINFVSTAKAKGKVLAILRRENREIQKQGEEILENWLKEHDYEMTTSVLDKLCDLHKLPKHANLFSAIGEKSIILGDTDFDELQGKRKPSSEGYSAKWRKYVPFLKRSSQKEVLLHYQRLHY